MLVSEAPQPPQPPQQQQQQQQQQTTNNRQQTTNNKQPPELNVIVCSGGQIPTLTILKSIQRGGFRIVNENT